MAKPLFKIAGMKITWIHLAVLAGAYFLYTKTGKKSLVATTGAASRDMTEAEAAAGGV